MKQLHGLTQLLPLCTGLHHLSKPLPRAPASNHHVLLKLCSTSCWLAAQLHSRRHQDILSRAGLIKSSSTLHWALACCLCCGMVPFQGLLLHGVPAGHMLATATQCCPGGGPLRLATHVLVCPLRLTAHAQVRTLQWGGLRLWCGLLAAAFNCFQLWTSLRVCAGQCSICKAIL